MKKHLIVMLLLSGLGWGCQAKRVTPVSVGKVWKARTVLESTILVYTDGVSTNIKPGYARFRLDLSKPGVCSYADIDGRVSTGTWILSTDNKRLILQDLQPQPTGTSGIIEYYITANPTEATLNIQRTAESRKTGNTVNDYALIPVQ